MRQLPTYFPPEDGIVLPKGFPVILFRIHDQLQFPNPMGGMGATGVHKLAFGNTDGTVKYPGNDQKQVDITVKDYWAWFDFELDLSKYERSYIGHEAFITGYLMGKNIPETAEFNGVKVWTNYMLCYKINDYFYNEYHMAVQVRQFKMGQFNTGV